MKIQSKQFTGEMAPLAVVALNESPIPTHTNKDSLIKKALKDRDIEQIKQIAPQLDDASWFNFFVTALNKQKVRFVEDSLLGIPQISINAKNENGVSLFRVLMEYYNVSYIIELFLKNNTLVLTEEEYYCLLAYAIALEEWRLLRLALGLMPFFPENDKYFALPEGIRAGCLDIASLPSAVQDGYAKIIKGLRFNCVLESLGRRKPKEEAIEDIQSQERLSLLFFYVYNNFCGEDGFPGASIASLEKDLVLERLLTLGCNPQFTDIETSYIIKAGSRGYSKARGTNKAESIQNAIMEVSQRLTQNDA